MTEPRSDDRPTGRPLPETEPAPPLVETAPPLAPADQAHSPWWSAPSGKPFSIPDFGHEFAAASAAMLASIIGAILAWLFPGPAPVPVPVKARPQR
jgi:hypothetical protein